MNEPSEKTKTFSDGKVTVKRELKGNFQGKDIIYDELEIDAIPMSRISSGRFAVFEGDGKLTAMKIVPVIHLTGNPTTTSSGWNLQELGPDAIERILSLHAEIG